MGMWVEGLEGRTLCDATVLSVPQAYASEGVAALTLGTIVNAVHTYRLGQAATLAADLKAAGNDKPTVALLRSAESAAAAAETAVRRANAAYAVGAARRVPLVVTYNDLFDARPGVKTNLRLLAAQDRVRLALVPKLATLSAAVTNGAAAVAAALAKLAAAPTVTGSATLAADVQTTTNDQVSLTEQAQTQIANLQTAVASLDGTATAPDPTAIATT